MAKRIFKPGSLAKGAAGFLVVFLGLIAAGSLYGGLGTAKFSPVLLGCGLFFLAMAGFIWHVSSKSHVAIFDDRLEFWRMGHHVVPWSEIESLEWISEGARHGAAGALVPRVLAYRLSGGQSGNIPVQLMKDAQELIAIIESSSPVAISR